MAYFDNAATTFPKPKVVYDYMDYYYRTKGGSLGRGSYDAAKSAKRLADETRLELQNILRCPARQIIFQPTATLSLNIIIQGVILTGAKNIYISPFEHNAVTRVLNYFEKKGQINVFTLFVDNNLTYDLQRIRFQFDSVTPDLVIVSHASNVIGLVAPLKEIFTLAKEYGAVTLADMSQTAGLVDCNTGEEIYDFCVFAGHKTLLGPTGVSGFTMKPDMYLPPILFGGTGFDSANQKMPKELPERFEIGTANIVGIAGLNAALKWINEHSIESIWQAEEKNRQRLIALLHEYDFMDILGLVVDRKYVGIVSCTMDGISSDIASGLFSSRNVAVRTGLQCAPAAHKFLDTFPAGTIRFSVNCLTSDDDFIELKNALDDIRDNL